VSTGFYRLPDNTLKDIETYAAETKSFIAGDLPAGFFRAKRVPRGVYEQRQDGTFMVRVRIAGGAVTRDQASRLSELSEKFGNGQLHVTTRQDIQLHNVDISDTPEVMKLLSEVELSSKGGGGNTVRNVVACPYAGICRTEIFDVTPYAHSVTEFLIPLTGSYNLPRKYKISFSGCNSDCAIARVNDLGFIARVSDGDPGFSVYAGGGMGAYSRTADLLEEWMPASEVVRVAEAVRRLFDRLGDRTNKHKARLRFVFDRIGVDEFRKLFREELAKVTDDGVPECAVASAVLHDPGARENGEGYRFLQTEDGVLFLPQRDPDLVSLPIRLRLGFIAAKALRQLGDLTERFSSDVGFRTTRAQGLIVRGVSMSDIDELRSELQQIGLDVVVPRALDRFVACAGASTCRLGLCLARGAADACADALDRANLDTDVVNSMNFNISGCPNSCGQHPVADIGLFGAARRGGARLLPAYRVVLGADLTGRKARLAEPVGEVPARAAPSLLISLADDYASNRQADERFANYYARQGKTHFEAIVAQHERIPDYEEDADYYRDWGSETDFSLAGRGAGECGAGVFEVMAKDISIARKALESGDGAESIFAAMLATARALLITRGVDAQEPDAVLRAFRDHFIATGLVAEEYNELVDAALSCIGDSPAPLEQNRQSVADLLARVELLSSTLDANLEFHPPDTEMPDKNGKNDEPPTGEEDTELLDLSGVACPMNFVKTKLRLEMMEIGDMLSVVLDDGPPIQNVPASLKSEGQEIVETTDLRDGHWKVVVKKVK